MSTIIIYRMGSLGDTLVALPCFIAIEKAFPLERRLCLTNFPVSSKALSISEILIPSGLIHGVIEFKSGTFNIIKIIFLIIRMRKIGSKTLIYLPGKLSSFKYFRDRVFFRLCGINNIIGLKSNASCHQYNLDNYPNSVMPEAKRLAFSIEQAIGVIDLDSRDSWNLNLSRNEIDAGNKFLTTFDGRPFFTINMGGKELIKDWGMSNWVMLINQLISDLPNFGLCIVGASDDFDRAEELLSIWPYKKLNLCGLIWPRICAGVLHKSSFFIGHDSGPMHLASTVGTSCIGLFGSYNQPVQWHPYGDFHRIIHEVNGIENISVERVVAEVRALNIADSIP